MPKAQPLFCAREAFAENGETFETILIRAADVLPAGTMAPPNEGEAGAAHEN